VNGVANVTFVPGAATGVASIEATCPSSGTKPKINVNVKK